MPSGHRKFSASACAVDAKASANWKTTKGGMMRATGIGGGIMGRGADLFIVDDYFGKFEECLSQAERDKRHRWIYGTMKTRLSPNGVVLIIATPYHMDDPMGRIKREELLGGDQWEVIKFPAIAGENDQLRRKPGEALWPDQWPLAKLQEIKKGFEIAGYPWMWQAMYQLEPPAVIDAEFDPSLLGESVMFNDWPHPNSIRFTVIALDPSVGKTDKSDYSAFVILKLGNDGTMWIDANLDRRDPWKITADALILGRQHRPDRICIEGNGFQSVLAGMFEEQSKAEGLMLPIVTFNSDEDKKIRIRRDVGPYLNRREMRFKRNSGGVALLMDQLRAFPNGDHDDGPDALQMAIEAVKDLFYSG